MHQRYAYLAFALALFGAGCDDVDHEQIAHHKNEYEIASCAYGFNDGGEAERAGAPDYRKFLFDKELDYSKIRAIAKASAAATLEFVQHEGVSVFAAHEPGEKSCPMFNHLPQAPSDLVTRFKDAGGQKNDGSFIVGLFIPKDSREVPSSSAFPMIGMRRDANRWTLVHEFSHYLFDTDFRRNGGMHTDELQKLYHDGFPAFNAAARAYNRNDTQANFDEATSKMLDAYKYTREIVLRFYAEEMAIETMLRNGLYTNELTFLPFERGSSYYYIFSSGEAALKELDKFTDQVSHLMTLASDKGYRDDYDKLEALRADLNSFKGEIAEKAEEAGVAFRSAGEAVNAPKQVLAPCEHVLEALKLTEGTKFDPIGAM